MTLTQTDFAFVATLVRQRSAIDLQPGKEYLVESRLTPIARTLGEGGLPVLISKLRSGDEQLKDSVVDALTTNETSWFRDSFPFQAYSNRLLPTVAEAALDRPVSVWSAACSSGQEAYSLAMLSLEWQQRHPGRSVRIVGTDISAKMVEKASSGRYSQLEVNRGLPAHYLVEHFERTGREWAVRPHVKALTQFRRGNLAQPQPGQALYDIVFLRNVLIYFDPPTKQSVLRNVARVIRPGGFLVLGGAESTLALDTAFRRVELEKAVVFHYSGGAR